MNYEAVADAEEFARAVLKMYSEEQTKLWKELKNRLPSADVELLQKVVALYDIFTLLNTAECVRDLTKDVFDLINRQKAEIERYKGVIKLLEKDVEAAKAEIERLKAELKELDKPNCSLEDVQQEEREQSKYFNLAMECARDKAIKEFVERLKNKIWHHSACNHEMLITTDDIDDLAREMTEVQK